MGDVKLKTWKGEGESATSAPRYNPYSTTRVAEGGRRKRHERARALPSLNLKKKREETAHSLFE